MRAPREPVQDPLLAQAYHEIADRTEAHKHGCVYFIEAGEGGPIKIGKTGCLKNRLSTLQIASSAVLRVLATAPGRTHRELAYHVQFADARLNGEWFARTPEIEAEIARLATLQGEA